MNQEDKNHEQLPPVNKLKLGIIGAVALIAVVSLLFYNKATRAAQTPRSAMLKEIPVTVAPVERKALRETLSLVGTVYANNDVNVLSETSGRITAVRVKVGDYVKAGRVLVQVDDELKRAALASAEVSYDKTKKDWDRYQTLFAKHSITAAQYDQARLAFTSAESQFVVARRQVNDTHITSPISGYVTARPVDIGAMVQPGTSVANVVDIATLKVKLNVAERDAFQLKHGDTVNMITEVYPGVTFRGTIQSIAAKADDAHTYPVEITLENSKDHPLKAGMFARVMFASLGSDNVLAVPRQALVGSIKEPQVFVVQDGRAYLRDIVVGNASGDTLGVRQGLSEAEQVVVNGQNNLSDSAQVSIVQ